MTIIPLTLTFVTPAFIGGADNTRHAEFRLPSLKGVLRYWWRQFQDQSNPRALFDKESRIFGSTKGQSRVYLWQVGPSPKLSPGGAAFNDSRDGIKYLFYSCYRLSQNQPGRLQWILPGESIQLACRLAGFTTDNNEVLLALYFAQTFGGLGYRSRRGAGSFQLAVDPAPAPADPLAPFVGLLDTTATDFIAAYTQHAITPYVWASLIHSRSPLATAFTTVNHFKPVNQPGATTHESVLNDIGRKMKHYRSVLEYDSVSTEPFHVEACALHTAGGAATPTSGPTYSAPNPLTKTAFGLPIIYRFRSRNAAGAPDGHEQWWIEASPVDHHRRASPLHVSVKRDTKNVPYANLLVLWRDYLPTGERIALTKKERVTVYGRPSVQPTPLGTVSQPTALAVTDFLALFP